MYEETKGLANNRTKLANNTMLIRVRSARVPAGRRVAVVPVTTVLNAELQVWCHCSRILGTNSCTGCPPASHAC